MFKKTALGIAAAAAITVTALSGTASEAQAGKVNFYFSSPGFTFGVGPGYYHGWGGGWGPAWGTPCWKYKKKWKKTGKKFWKWKYYDCIDYYN